MTAVLEAAPILFLSHVKFKKIEVTSDQLGLALTCYVYPVLRYPRIIDGHYRLTVRQGISDSDSHVEGCPGSLKFLSEPLVG
jgi:hypothetical protein